VVRRRHARHARRGSAPGLEDLSFDDVVRSSPSAPTAQPSSPSVSAPRSAAIPPRSRPRSRTSLVRRSTRSPARRRDERQRRNQTGAMGVHDFLLHKGSAAAAKVVNVPGCPTNPWWFVLTVVAFLVDLKGTLGAPAGTEGPLGILTATAGLPAITGGVDHSRRLNAVYGTPLHGPACDRYDAYTRASSPRTRATRLPAAHRLQGPVGQLALWRARLERSAARERAKPGLFDGPSTPTASPTSAACRAATASRPAILAWHARSKAILTSSFRSSPIRQEGGKTHG
jgi:hypothetical protein